MIEAPHDELQRVANRRRGFGGARVGEGRGARHVDRKRGSVHVAVHGAAECADEPRSDQRTFGMLAVS